MRRICVLITLLTAFVTLPEQAVAQYNNWAFGFRLGEPSGVNVRKYFGDNHAFDLNVGTYGGLYGNNRAYRSGNYKTVGLSIQGHYLWHDRLFGKDNFRGYYGFGGQINSRRYYPERLAALNEYESAIALGGSAVAGLEYFVPNKQYSIFVETGLYVEVLPAPLFMNLSSGVGIRFNL
ncbi:hypothetical protein [Fibrella aquatica]|uniref:hypothetical protein n=1 Tax=Fibrella aquatica TaxID=3242487 RepID=UPI003520AACB